MKTYDCQIDGVPKTDRRKISRGTPDPKVELMFNGFENAINNADTYWAGYLRAMRSGLAEILRDVQAPSGYLKGRAAIVEAFNSIPTAQRREFELDALYTAVFACEDAAPEPKLTTFDEAWAGMQARGYQYGEDALAGVRLGYAMAQTQLEPIVIPHASERDPEIETRSIQILQTARQLCAFLLDPTTDTQGKTLGTLATKLRGLLS